METYIEQKKRHGDEVNAFEGIFFAFNTEQFIEGLKSIGLDQIQKHEIYSIGAGGYILKTRSKDFSNMFKRHAKERAELKKEEKTLIEALAYELRNHEYCITYDASDALNALGWSGDEIDPKILKKAIALAV